MIGLPKAIVILLICVAVALSADPYEANPFYVDPSSVQKGDYKISMKLKNHHQSSLAVSGTANNPEITLAAASAEVLDQRVLRFKMTDVTADRWEVKLSNKEAGKRYQKALLSSMGFSFVQDPFGFSITDPKTGEIFVSTLPGTNSSLKFYDKYIELGMWFPNKRAFGLGERVTPAFELCTNRDWCVYTTFTRDEASPLDLGEAPGGKQDYSQHPFYMIQLKNGMFIAVLFLNSNAQDTVLVKVANDALNVYHKTVGGIIDTYFFYPGKAEEVMQKYHELIGRPYVPPFWSLGFHQCRYGWASLKVVQDVVARFEQADIPLEVVWGDIDYMLNYADFTVDPVRYAGLGQFVKELHKKKMRWVPIIDAGIKYDKADPFYQKGEASGAYIKSAVTRKTLIGKVWPGYAVFPDWMNPSAKALWLEGLASLHSQAEFDGIWIDMNEASNFCNGECDPGFSPNKNLRRPTDDPFSILSDPHDPKEFDKLPYLPGGKDLNEKAVSMTGYHMSTDDYGDKFYKEYNMHSMWAVDEAKATNQYFTERLNTRPFVLTRSSFPGSGMYTSKWLGDNYASWEYMRYSIVGSYNMQMFGIPLVGADMCGFILDTTEELCARWMQMGAFYPFSRNHNDVHSKAQEPYLWEKVATASRNALRQKYSLLRYYYTQMYEASLNGGSMMRPLFFEYPTDEKAYSKSEYTFMIGPALLIAPVLHPGLVLSYPYCPNENWYNAFSGAKLYEYVPDSKEGKQLTLDAGFDYVNVLLRGGYIIPFQDALTAKVRRTEALKSLPMEVIVAPDHNGEAQGSIVTDDGDSVDPITNQAYRYLNLTFSAEKKRLTVQLVHDYKNTFQFEKFSKVRILNAKKFAGLKSACITNTEGIRMTVSTSYDSEKEVLTVYKMTSFSWPKLRSVDLDDCAKARSE